MSLQQLLLEQRRVVRHGQLVALGVAPRSIRRHMQMGEWLRLLHGVYAVPPFEEPMEVVECRGALLYGGADAAISHLTRLRLAGIPVPPDEPLHIDVPRERGVRSTSGLRVHCVRTVVLGLERPHGLRVVPLPVALAQAWRDAATTPDRHALVCAAIEPGLVSAAEVAAAAGPSLLRRRELIATAGMVEAGCHSPIEIDYLRDVERRFRLPAGRRQARVFTLSGDEFRVDVLYEAERVIVELDGQWHRTDPAQRRADERRDALLSAAGYQVLRFTWEDVRRRPGWVAACVRDALAGAA